MEIDGIPRRIEVPLKDFAAAIHTYVRKLAPDLVITHGSNGEYGHPQHIYTHQATRLALTDTGADIALASWSAWYTPSDRERILNPDDPADIVADISPWHDVKVAAVLCHKTQHAMFLRNTGAATVSDMTWKTESFHMWQGTIPNELR
jgi:LmbE family N-acetylglucosaminyl deacetylase